MTQAFGDSITAGTGASPSTNSWVNLFTVTNSGVSNAQAADMSRSIQLVTPDPTKKYTLMIGTNDHRTYKNDATKMEFFKRFLRQSVAWLGLPTKVTGRDASMSYTGTWNNTASNTFGKQTTQNGATAGAVVYGTAVYIGYIIQNYSGANGQVDVRIDGNLVGTLNSFGAMNTALGASYAGACQRFGGLAPGAHTVTLTVTSATGQIFYLDYIAGNDQAATPRIPVSNIIDMSAAAYVTYGTSQANVDLYNGIIAGLVAELVADGFNTVLVDNHASVIAGTDLAPDGVHPGNSGHLKIHNNFSDALV